MRHNVDGGILTLEMALSETMTLGRGFSEAKRARHGNWGSG